MLSTCSLPLVYIFSSSLGDRKAVQANKFWFYFLKIQMQLNSIAETLFKLSPTMI